MARADLSDREPDDEIVLMMINNESIQPGWYLDSGASNHVCCDKNRFQDLKKEQKSRVTVTNGVQVEKEGRDKVAIQFLYEKRSAQKVQLQYVLFVPGVKRG